MRGTPADARDFRARPGDLTREGSWLVTAERNVDLIDLARKIESENRAATPEEQARLAKYVGFGASEIRNSLFPVAPQHMRLREPERLIWPELTQGRWKSLAERIAALPKEWQQSVLQSTQYAHYTSANIIDSIWSAMQRLGFTGGRILEPGAGIGSFAMLMPDSIRLSSRYTGIEFDAPTALIGRLLSPEQQLMHDDFIRRGTTGFAAELAGVLQSLNAVAAILLGAVEFGGIDIDGVSRLVDHEARRRCRRSIDDEAGRRGLDVLGGIGQHVRLRSASRGCLVDHGGAFRLGLFRRLLIARRSDERDPEHQGEDGEDGLGRHGGFSRGHHQSTPTVSARNGGCRNRACEISQRLTKRLTKSRRFDTTGHGKSATNKKAR